VHSAGGCPTEIQRRLLLQRQPPRLLLQTTSTTTPEPTTSTTTPEPSTSTTTPPSSSTAEPPLTTPLPYNKTNTTMTVAVNDASTSTPGIRVSRSRGQCQVMQRELSRRIFPTNCKSELQASQHAPMWGRTVSARWHAHARRRIRALMGLSRAAHTLHLLIHS
jgi:hypothetical protein